MIVGVLDSEIDEEYVKKQDVERNQINERLLSHGEKCARIILKHGDNISIICESILNLDGTGIITDLPKGLENCFLRNAKIVNISFGSTHFQDKEYIRKIINHYTNKGMIIIAASSNDGYISYPASFSNVIGVATGCILGSNLDMCIQMGIDFFAPLDYEIDIGCTTFLADKGNSFAAPFVTAIVGNLVEKKGFMSVEEIRQELSHHEIDYIYAPDWIEKAWVSSEYHRKEHFYFDVDSRELQECLDEIDTLILFNKNEYYSYNGLGKHIVYLGKEKIKTTDNGCHFWSREVQKKRIISSLNRPKEIDVPFVYCCFDVNEDVISFLNLLKKQFYIEGYNAFVGCNNIDCVLNDLEYLPIDDLMNNKIEDYVFWQVHYQQADVILIGGNSDNEYCRFLCREPNLIIKIERKKEMIYMEIGSCQNHTKKDCYLHFQTEDMRSIAQKIISIL